MVPFNETVEPSFKYLSVHSDVDVEPHRKRIRVIKKEGLPDEGERRQFLSAFSMDLIDRNAQSKKTTGLHFLGL